MKTTYKLLMGLLLSSTSISSIAATSTVAEDTWKLVRPKSDVAALGPNLFGDSSSIYTGATEFHVTDVSLPGNNNLPVSIGRRFVATKDSADPLLRFGDWDFDIPYMYGNFAGHWKVSSPGTEHQRCSVSVNNPAHGAPPSAYGTTIPSMAPNVPFASYEYWQGNSLYIPGSGSKRLMLISSTNANRPSSGDHRWVTNDNWLVSCLPATANQYPGESFLVTSPDGTRYWFNWFTHMIGKPIQKSGGPGGEFLHSLVANEVRIYPTKIADRYGNEVIFTYDTSNPEGYPSTISNRLKSISSNDGRLINVFYGPNGKVSSVVANGRTWTYEYDSEKRLKKVILPDSSRWEYSIENLSKIDWIASHASCADAGSYSPTIWTGTIKHPSGAIGNFTFQRKRLGRSYVPKECYSISVPFQTAHMDVASIIKKEISGPGIIPRTWEFDYGPYNGSYDWDCNNSGNCPTTRTTTITENGQRWTRHVISNRYGPLEGKTLKTEYGDASGIHRAINYSYLTESTGQPYPSKIGTLPCYRCDRSDETLNPIQTVEVLLGGDSFKKTTNTYDRFARAEVVQSASTLGYSRSEFQGFHDDFNHWVIGQPRLSYTLDSAPNGVSFGQTLVSSEVGYNSLAQPVSKKQFGKLIETLTYHPDGMLATVTDGRGNVTSISNWKRGVPRRIDFPATPEAPSGAFATATVDDNGWITSVSNEVDAVTGYGYDAMGRLASIVQPSGDVIAAPSSNGNYYSTLRNFRPLTASDWKPAGIVDGQWRLYEETGTRVSITYLDALWRPILKHEFDAQNTAATLRASKTTYDAIGRVNFQSYPSSDVIPGASGTRTFYDALDRVTRVEQDSEHGVLATTTQYLSGLKTLVTNPKGFSTTTSFMAWNQPTYDFPVLSEQPEGKVIQIGRHPQFGWPLQLTQRNAANTLSATRRYVYDGHAQLCKTIEPETGATVMGYDDTGNPTWQAAGLDAGTYGSLTDCQYVAASNSGRVVSRQYDARNRLTHLIFPNGLGNQIWTYEKDNLPKSITAYNNAGNATPVITTYAYNKRRLLVGETLAQPGWYSWSVGYAYDGYGHMSTQTYPTGLVVDYAPNPLGQPTKAGTYASGAQYYPNGALKQFTYGNGIVHTMTQNARQLPERTTSSGGVLDFHNFYDANGNVEHIANRLVEGYDLRDRWMQYDQLDRLTSAGSGSFGGDHWHRMTYDALDNLKSWKLAGVKDYAEYVYDAQNYRLTSIRNTAGATVVGLSYDPQGNLNNKNGQAYLFDFGNRLRDVSGKENYRYDGLGRRVLAWQYPTPAKPSGTVTLSQYTHSGQVIYQEDHDRSTAMEHIYLAGSIIATREPNWATGQVSIKYQHTDALGSPVAVSNASGQVVERMDYEPWGAIIGKPNHNGVGYTGHVMDGATGLTYMQQRYYDQSIGRFLSVDPVAANSGSGANFNRYWYANNNPYRYIDPDGRKPCAGSFCEGYRTAGSLCEAACVSTNSGNPGRRTRDWFPDNHGGSDRIATSDGPRLWLSPTGKGVRGCDGYGCGHNGARRAGGARQHLGSDYVSNSGQSVVAPTNGTVERYSNPYADDQRYSGVLIRTDEGHAIRVWYLKPNDGIIGSEVRAGQEIGISQDLNVKYTGNMTNHIHVRVTSSDGGNIDPASLTLPTD